MKKKILYVDMDGVLVDFDRMLKENDLETKEDIDKIKKLEEENKRLKELLVQKDIKGFLDEAYLEYAAKQMGYKNVEELKKKLNLK